MNETKHSNSAIGHDPPQPPDGADRMSRSQDVCSAPLDDSPRNDQSITTIRPADDQTCHNTHADEPPGYGVPFRHGVYSGLILFTPDGSFIDDDEFSSCGNRVFRSTPAFWLTLSWRLALLLFIIVCASSTLAFVLSATIGSVLPPETSLFTAMIVGRAVKDILFPLLTIILAMLMIGMTARRFTKPVSTISDATKSIAAGDYSARVPETDRFDEIGVLQRNFNIMAKELESNELIRKDFTANISHEFKTPLAIIQGYSRLLEEDNVSDEDRQKYARLITRESERLARLSSNMLRLSKLENQQIIVSPKKFLLDEQILQAVVLLEPKWEKKRIGFNVNMDETWFSGDEELLSQVWFNLSDNAIKFSHEDSEITISLTRSDGMLVVSITDQGVGIDTETSRNAFSKYYQGQTAEKREGSGLGLSIVKRIVELHNGSVEISGTPGIGTTVRVSLPDNAETHGDIKL